MTQQPRGACLSEFNPRPDVLSVPFIGQVEKLAHYAHNMWSDEPQPRRADGIRQKYGSGTPTLNGAKTNWAGIPIPAQYFQKASTSAGDVYLPVESESEHFMPTVSDLTTSLYDTRLQPTPGRYYP